MRIGRSSSQYATLVGLLMAAAAAPLGAQQARAVGSFTAPLAIAASSRSESDPAVTFGRDRFLVVYTRWLTDGTGDIYGRFVSPADGTVGKAFVIDNLVASSSFSPVAAFNPDQSYYLVVYEDHRLEYFDRDMNMTVIDVAGNVLGAGYVSFEYTHETGADVAYLGNHTWLVVWCEATDLADPYDGVVKARTVSFDGTDISASEPITLSDVSSTQSLAGSMYPRVAVNAAGQALVVWQWPRDMSSFVPAEWDYDIHACLLDNTGQPIGSGGSVIRRTSAIETLPCVAYSPSEDRFLISWQSAGAGGNCDILAAIAQVDALGHVITAPPVTLASQPQDEVRPSVTWNAASGEFLVAWQYVFSPTDSQIRAVAVSPTGVVGPVVTLAATTSDERAPSLAYGLGQVLATWERQAPAGTNVDVYGAWSIDRLPGDVDGDGEVSVLDVVEVVTRFGYTSDHPDWNANCDLDSDGEITVLDIVTVVTNFGLKD